MDNDREQLEILALQLQTLSAVVELGGPLITRLQRLLMATNPGGDRDTRAWIEA